MSDFSNPGSKVGLEVWRIEKLTAVLLPTAEHGKFSEGDSYIVLKTTQPKTALVWDVFFWLGSASTADERGVAAYKTVELDDILGGAPVQHREEQGKESEEFVQCFKTLQYRKGGVSSGFKHVDRDAYETRLLRIKGARSVRVNQVPLSASSLNAGDVFLLDTGLAILQWNGAEASRKEKSKALEVALGIKDDERGGKATFSAFEQGEESAEFWAALGGEGPIAPALTDAAPKAASRESIKLIKVSDDSGSLKQTTVATGDLKKEMLKSADVYIVDNGALIFVWVGKAATAAERKEGMALGVLYSQSTSRAAYTKVTKVSEGTETAVFKSLFESWKPPPAPLEFSAGSNGHVAPPTAQDSSADLAAMMAKAALAGDEAPMDDGEGALEMYRMEDFEPVRVDEATLGQFFAGDSYIVKYTSVGDKESTILYFWLGKDSSADEKGAAALHARKMDDLLGGRATQVRVVQGKEPAHLVSLFHGKFIVHKGGRASGFKNRGEGDSYDEDGVALYHVKGHGKPTNTKAVQVAESAHSLNSGDCFILVTPAAAFLWKGEGASAVEAQTAAAVAAVLKQGRTLETVGEGAEPEAFWAALCGKGEYPTAKDLPEPDREPRLFVCSNATGAFTVAPIHDFSQADLDVADVFVLDVFNAIFLWVGSEATKVEKAMAAETAAAYVAAQGYSVDTPVVTINSGEEPLLFTSHFVGWDASKARVFVDPYEAKLAAALANNPAPNPMPERSDFLDPLVKKQQEEEAAAKAEMEAELAAEDDSPESARPPAAAPAPAPAPAPAAYAAAAPAPAAAALSPGQSVPYDVLKTDNLPAGVDSSKKEEYLSDADFASVFKISRAEFAALKPWKAKQVKQAAGLW